MTDKESNNNKQINSGKEEETMEKEIQLLVITQQCADEECRGSVVYIYYVVEESYGECKMMPTTCDTCGCIQYLSSTPLTPKSQLDDERRYLAMSRLKKGGD